MDAEPTRAAAWAALFPEELQTVAVPMAAYFTERAYLAGRVSCGDAQALDDLRRLDPAAALMVATTVLTISALPGGEEEEPHV